MSAVLEIAGLVAVYRPRAVAYGTLRDRLARRRTAPSASRVALDDVHLDVRGGELVAVVGANGAGKTTLLRCIARTVHPEGGRIVVHGRLAGLIELGAGFHPELSARENVRLHGALLGLARREVEAGLPAVLAFAGLADRADEPVKRFSTGLYARLGFSVAVHAAPDLLLVDEVLSVGDEAFQARGLERLAALRAGGAGILWVSHDLDAVAARADRAVWLEAGRLRATGPAADVVAAYRSAAQEA